MTTNKVDYVDAIFGDSLVRFKLKTDDVLAAMVLKSPYAVFRRLADGAWSPDDVRNVLTYAHPKSKGPISPDVTRTLDSGRYSIATYAALAARILEASIFHIDVDRALFDEKVAIG